MKRPVLSILTSATLFVGAVLWLMLGNGAGALLLDCLRYPVVWDRPLPMAEARQHGHRTTQKDATALSVLHVPVLARFGVLSVTGHHSDQSEDQKTDSSEDESRGFRSVSAN